MSDFVTSSVALVTSSFLLLLVRHLLLVAMHLWNCFSHTVCFYVGDFDVLTSHEALLLQHRVEVSCIQITHT